LPETTCQIRVRYAETDGMGIVYYANYLTWFEVARTDWLRQLGASYRELEQREGVYLPVVEARCRYHKPARYDDVIEIRTMASRPSRAQIRFDYELWRLDDRDLLARGSTWHVAVNVQGKPRRFPDRLLELLT
jgi:acyl-CoA thioester hydrolase